MNILRRTISLCMVLWLTLIITMAGVPGVVLCIGGDGHLSFELAHEGGCAGELDNHPHAGDSVATELEAASCVCCGDCVDVELTSDTLLQLTQKDVAKTFLKFIDQKPLAILAFGRCVTDGFAVGVSPHYAAPPGNRLSLFAQRTIVLRV